MTTRRSQNGWPVLASDQLRRWRVPGVPSVTLPLVRGSGGFLLTHVALWFHECVEQLDVGHPRDDWGWADRPIAASSDTSNHASGTAVDLNATQHPLGVPTSATFATSQVTLIRRRLDRVYGGTVRWGGDYRNRPDAMHFEIDAPRRGVHALVRNHLVDTPRGIRVLALNPWIKREDNS